VSDTDQILDAAAAYVVLMDQADHARVLFGAISLALSTTTCASRTPEPAQPPIEFPAMAPATSPPPPPLVHIQTDPNTVVTTQRPRSRPTYKTRRYQYVEGRPFTIDGAPRLANLARGVGWADDVDLSGARPTPTERDALVRHYTDWALAEHASIASFARFTLQLLALGAPPSLVSRSARAMADEIRHARFGFGLVRSLSGRDVTVAELSMDKALDGEVTLESVLRLAVREGIMGETFAALEVRHVADLAELPWLKAALEAIADDEARHAELAFVFAAWACARSPELASVMAEEIAECDNPPLPTADGLARWGVLDEKQRRAVRERSRKWCCRSCVDSISGLRRRGG